MSDLDISNAISLLRLGIEPSPLLFLQETVDSTNAKGGQAGKKKQRGRRGGKGRRKSTKDLTETMATGEIRSSGLDVLPTLPVPLLPAVVKDQNSQSGKGSANGPAKRLGNGSAKAHGNSSAKAFGNGSAKALGNGSAKGPGNGSAKSPGNDSAKAPGKGSAKGPGNGPAKARKNGSAKAPGNAPAKGIDANCLGKKAARKGTAKSPGKGSGNRSMPNTLSPKKVVRKTVGDFKCTSETCGKAWSSVHAWTSRTVICEWCNSKAKILDFKDEECELDNYACGSCKSVWQSIHDDGTLEQFCDICEVMVQKEKQTQKRFGRHFWYKCKKSKECGGEWEDFYMGKIYSQRCKVCFSEGLLLNTRKDFSPKEKERQRARSLLGSRPRHDVDGCGMCQALKRQGVAQTCRKKNTVLFELDSSSRKDGTFSEIILAAY